MIQKNKSYTASDIERYYAGTMPAGEMHELEKAALEDPFLEDALEGFVNTSAFKSDIKDLNNRLEQKRKKTNIFSFASFIQNRWLRIAAMFIIVTGAGYLFYLVNNNSENNSLAKSDITTAAELEDSIAFGSLENATTSNDSMDYQQAINPENNKKPALPSVRSFIKKEALNYGEKDKSPAPSSLYKSDAGNYSDSANSEESITKNEEHISKENLLKGKVTDEKGKAVPLASIKDNNRDKTTVTDSGGHFILRSKDSNIMATASATGFKTKTFNLKKDVHPTIAVNKTNGDLNEVAITGYSTQSKKSSLPKEMNRKAPGIQVKPAGMEPSGGPAKFDQYLQDNIAPVYNDKGDRLTGEVTLSFTLNKKGKPENITVISSTCPGCEKEAIKLLENGPGWKAEKNDKGTVVIKF